MNLNNIVNVNEERCRSWRQLLCYVM